MERYEDTELIRWQSRLTPAPAVVTPPFEKVGQTPTADAQNSFFVYTVFRLRLSKDLKIIFSSSRCSNLALPLV